MTAVPLDGDRLDALRADVFAEVSLATGWDDSVDELVDVKNELTAAVMQLVVAALRASWAEAERLNGYLRGAYAAMNVVAAERDEARAALAAAERTLADVAGVTDRMEDWARGDEPLPGVSCTLLAKWVHDLRASLDGEALIGRAGASPPPLLAASRTGAADKETCEHGRTGWHEVPLSDREAIGCPGPAAAEGESDR